MSAFIVLITFCPPANYFLVLLCQPLFQCNSFLSGADNKPLSHETDNDSGKGTMTSYGSVNSLNSNSSSLTTSLPNDNPEQFEAFKQQKEIKENGIEM